MASSSVIQVQISPGVRIELLPRGKNESTVRLAEDYGPNLKSGMYVMAAVQGRTRISFYKLPESVVRKELDRLQVSNQEYGLVVTSTYPTATPTAPPQLVSPNVFSPSLVFQSARRAATTSNLPPLSTDAVVSPKKQYSTDNDNNSIGDDESDDIPSIPLDIDRAFLESVERLRAQRRIVETLKRDSQQKVLKIESLSTDIRQFQQQIEELRLENETLRRSSATTKSLEESLSYERAENTRIEKEFQKARAEFKVKETILTSELANERKQYEEERVALHSALEESQLQHSDSLFQIDELKKLLRQSNEEREAAELREEQTRRSSERIILEQREREVKADHALERVRIERDKANKKIEELEATVVIQRSQISAQRDAADHTRERYSVLERTVNELEENCRDLRAQLNDSESKSTSKEREYQVEIERLKRELDSIADVREESKRGKEEMRISLEEEIKAHRTTREQLVAMESGKREAEEASDRAMRHAKTANDRLAELSRQKDILHERLVRALAKGNSLADELEEERRAGRVLAETRLELLSQFVEEERRLDGTLGMSTGVSSSQYSRGRKAPPLTAERKLEFSSPARPPPTTTSSTISSLRRVPETPDGWIRKTSI